MTTQQTARYTMADLSDSERQVIANLRRITEPRGYGELRVTVKNGQVVIIRREHISQVRSDAYGQ